MVPTRANMPCMRAVNGKSMYVSIAARNALPWRACLPAGAESIPMEQTKGLMRHTMAVKQVRTNANTAGRRVATSNRWLSVGVRDTPPGRTRAPTALRDKRDHISRNRIANTEVYSKRFQSPMEALDCTKLGFSSSKIQAWNQNTTKGIRT